MTESSLNTGSSAPNDLYLLIAGGDEQAFRQAHDLFKARLFFYARRFRLEWDEVKDVVADAFLGLWNSRTQLQSNDHLRNLLYIAVKNQALKVLNARNREQTYLNSINQADKASVDEELISHKMIEAELVQLLADGIAELAPDYRRIFELSYYEGKNPREIAQLLDINPATVRSQKRRAIEMLRSWIKKRSFLLLLAVQILARLKSF